MEITIREIKKEDDPVISSVVESVLVEHGVNRPGTAYYYDSLNHMSDFYLIRNGIYFIGSFDGKVSGGAGIYPTDGLPEATCELVKMYLLPEARGKGLGKALIEKYIAFAHQNGYTKVYLETMPELQNAVRVYEKLGFTLIPNALGNSGHFVCTIRMIKDI